MADPQMLMTEIARELYPAGYVLAPTPDGFTVDRNLADASWVIPIGIAQVKSVIGHQVALDPVSSSLTITDTSKDVEWRMGLDGVTPVAVASANMSTFRGRRIAMGGTKQFGMRLDGSVGAIQDYTYNTEIARECIERVAATQGWNQSASRSPMGASEKVGLGVAIGAIVLAVGILAVIFL